MLKKQLNLLVFIFNPIGTNAVTAVRSSCMCHNPNNDLNRYVFCAQKEAHPGYVQRTDALFQCVHGGIPNGHGKAPA